jgi:hypothetical protein
LVMAQRIEWVLLAYRLPREPSTPRIALWRKLKRLGVAQLVDGLVALPSDARTKEQLDWLADEVLEAGGEATVWEARPGSSADERRLASRMAAVISEEYEAVIAAALDAEREATVDGRTLARLRRELQRIGRRDFFPPAERDAAHAAVRRLSEVAEGVGR